MMDKLVKISRTNLIVNLFMGVGTAGIAALRSGKRFVGVKVLKKYCQIAAKRLSDT